MKADTVVYQTSSNIDSEPSTLLLYFATYILCLNSSGHMKEGLLYIINGAENHVDYGPGIWRDAQLIYDAIDSKGRNDKQLVWRYETFFSQLFP